MLACLSGSSSIASDPWLDHRYFWYDSTSSECHCTCGIARETGALVVRQTALDRFLDDRWWSCLDHFEGNPSIVGFIAEQVCLSAISSLGLHHRDIHCTSAPTEVIAGNSIPSNLPLQTSSTFFVPQEWNNKDIDALYLQVDDKKKTVFVAPFQIATGNHKKHKDSEASFYARWDLWEKRYFGYKLKSTFVWVVECQRSWGVIPEQWKELRSRSQTIVPTHKQIYITFQELYPALGIRLKALRAKSKVSVSLPWGLIQGAEEGAFSEDFSDKNIPDDGIKAKKSTPAGTHKGKGRAAKKAKVRRYAFIYMKAECGCRTRRPVKNLLILWHRFLWMTRRMRKVP